MSFCMAVTLPNIAIVGTGPTGLYALKTLVQQDSPLVLTLFEAGGLAGVGQPYSPDSAQVSMLANIASIEIPALTRPYLDWLQTQPDTVLQLYGVDPETLDDRQFLPRLLLGSWLRDELEALIEAGRAKGHMISLREGTRVTDVAPVGDDIRLSFETRDGADSLIFTHAILATGHDWPDDPEDDPSLFVSPWTGLMEAEVEAVGVGILGTSLSGIDAAMAVACQHGRFVEGETLEFERHPGSEALKITLMSRNGILPEVDFYCPLPYRPLRHFTEAALARAAEAGSEGLLDRLFALFCREIADEDPDWAAAADLEHQTPETFSDRYFAPRLEADTFDWAERNLREAERDAQELRTVAWRYAILRMHEPMERMVARLNDADRARFAGLKRMFIDNYAAVPPQSIQRLLALRRAGCIDVLALGDNYRLERDDGVTRVATTEGQVARFDVLIDARGQRALTAADLPFPTLRDLMVAAGDEISMDEGFCLNAEGLPDGRVFLPAAPYLLSRLPFVQGITASADLGETVAARILQDQEMTGVRAA
jgi:uncharacterized NAD(P)/FAD-binding protein YdhS